MDGFWSVLGGAFALVFALDPDSPGNHRPVDAGYPDGRLFACLIGLPLGAAVGVFRFPGRTFLSVALNALMGLPRSWSALSST